MCPASLSSLTKSSRWTVSFGTVILNCWHDALSCLIEYVSTYSVLVTVLTASFVFSLVMMLEMKFAPMMNCSPEPSERVHVPQEL